MRTERAGPRRSPPVRRAAVLCLGVLAAACSSSSHDRTAGSTASTSVRPASTTTTTGTPATTAPVTSTTLGPVPTAAVMVQLTGRTIIALDASGHALKTLVTVFQGREVTDAAFAPDHKTIWYATRPLDNQSCPQIVKLNLQTNARTVVSHATDFALTPDGSKLLLVFPSNDAAVRANCGASVQTHYDDAFVVRDLATGAQSSFPAAAYPSAGTGGPSGPVWMSPAGDRLIEGTCVEDGCATVSFTVPKNLGGPIVREQANAAPACGCATLVSGPGGVYGIDQGGFNAPQTRLRRYDPAHLAGRGTVLVESETITLTSVVPTSAGLFVIGGPNRSHTSNLYRVDNGALHLVGSLPQPLPPFFAIFPVPPRAAN